MLWLEVNQNLNFPVHSQSDTMQMKDMKSKIEVIVNETDSKIMFSKTLCLIIYIELQI